MHPFIAAAPTMMLRTDMNALPITETTGLPYASTVTAKDDEGVEVGVAQACGHDLHVTWVIGALQAGTKENITPDDATLKLNIRTYDEDVREHMLGAVRRICCAECQASDAPCEPEFSTLSSYPLTDNDAAAATARVAPAFQVQFGANAYEMAPASASEDCSVFGRRWNVPYVFWIGGGTDPQAKADKQLNALPSNHSPKYAPVLDPTLKTGLQAMLAAAAAWLGTSVGASESAA